ncbi:hypothetical protein [Halorubrum sp. 48-1-W]|uniref:hypothetical protein n=1 Tax=Halorubrum sp. 48-1-W TaxID=2249761 RepID=UPI000FC9FF0C|nr:hypothetical protein [Halorubrum sp. 48-1-W]
MYDQWLIREEMPNRFNTEQDFSKQLTDQLDGLKFKRSLRDPSDVTGEYILEAKHSTGDGNHPDITLSHKMPTGGNTELSNPFFIECKLGDAYRSEDSELISFIHTGIKKIQIEFSQLFRYHYGDKPVSFSENIEKGNPNKYEHTMPEGKHKVLFTCPFLLTRPSNIIQDQCECCGRHSNQHLIETRKQFCRTIRDLGFGVFYRKDNGKLVFRTSYHGNYRLLESRTESA